MKKWLIIVLSIVLVLILFFSIHLSKEKDREPGEAQQDSQTEESNNVETQEDFRTKYYDYVPTDPTEMHYYILQENDLQECGAETEFFTVPFISINTIQDIWPMGWPHTIPTPQLVFKFPPEITEDVDFFAPGDMTIIEISDGFHSGMEDVWVYDIVFYVCKDVKLSVGHVTELEPKFMEYTTDRENCRENSMEAGCSFLVNIPVKAGEKIGKVSWDFGPEVPMVDLRTEKLAYANPDRYYEEQFHSVCMFDYYAPELRSRFLEKVGLDGEKRTLEPICGTVMQDIPGTAQGVWFLGTDSRDSQDNPLTLSYHFITHTTCQISIGTDSLGVDQAGYKFPFQQSGLINRNFKDVVPGNVYCFETKNNNYNEDAQESYVFLIEFLDSDTLRLEHVDLDECGVGEWVFVDPVEFVR